MNMYEYEIQCTIHLLIQTSPLILTYIATPNKPQQKAHPIGLGHRRGCQPGESNLGIS